MARALPLLKQEPEDSCALACLRMVLAGRGIVMTEAELEQRVWREKGGTEIRELERLARGLGLTAAVQEVKAREIRDLLQAGGDVIAYLNRAVFDLRSLADLGPALRALRVHAVVPILVTGRQITFHDPLLPAVVRMTIQRFEAAQRHMWSICLVLLHHTDR
jgi:ABC-type bacteriocin/lantibiotic exporter with double-glycine peptidase domain